MDDQAGRQQMKPEGGVRMPRAPVGIGHVKLQRNREDRQPARNKNSIGKAVHEVWREYEQGGDYGSKRADGSQGGIDRDPEAPVMQSGRQTEACEGKSRVAALGAKGPRTEALRSSEDTGEYSRRAGEHHRKQDRWKRKPHPPCKNLAQPPGCERRCQRESIAEAEHTRKTDQRAGQQRYADADEDVVEAADQPEMLVIRIDALRLDGRLRNLPQPRQMPDPHSLGLVDDPLGNSLLDILLSDHADSNVSMTRLWLV